MARSDDEVADGPSGTVRIDKWLWAARFYKTRSLAADAVTGGKVELNGERPKPAKGVKPGDELRIRSGVFEQVIHVRALSDRAAACGIAGRRSGQLAGRTRAPRPMAGAHRRRGQAALRRRSG